MTYNSLFLRHRENGLVGRHISPRANVAFKILDTPGGAVVKMTVLGMDKRYRQREGQACKTLYTGPLGKLRSFNFPWLCSNTPATFAVDLWGNEKNTDAQPATIHVSNITSARRIIKRALDLLKAWEKAEDAKEAYKKKGGKKRAVKKNKPIERPTSGDAEFRYQLYKIGPKLYFSVVEQAERLRIPFTYKTSNGVYISSQSIPEISRYSGTIIYIRGSTASADHDTDVECCASPDAAEDLRRKLEFALDEWISLGCPIHEIELKEPSDMSKPKVKERNKAKAHVKAEPKVQSKPFIYALTVIGPNLHYRVMKQPEDTRAYHVFTAKNGIKVLSDSSPELRITDTIYVRGSKKEMDNFIDKKNFTTHEKALRFKHRAVQALEEWQAVRCAPKPEEPKAEPGIRNRLMDVRDRLKTRLAVVDDMLASLDKAENLLNDLAKDGLIPA